MPEDDEQKILVMDIESRNHLKKDCSGDVTKLKIGIVGIKVFGKHEVLFFDEGELDKLEKLLLEAEWIVGFNLVGHNGLDYQMLKNYGIDTDMLLSKTFDIMTTMIRTFGSYKNLNLDNLVENTFGQSKKATKKANYKLIQNNQIEKLKENLMHELYLIEKLCMKIVNGETVRFETSMGLIDEHELPPFDGAFPEPGEEIIEPYDFPFAGMRLQIKDKVKELVRCEGCDRNWTVESVCYYGDTIHQKVHCPHCRSFLVGVRSNMLGEQTRVLEHD